MEAQPVADEAMTVETAQAYQALCAFCSWALLADVGEEDVARLAGDRSLFLEPPFSQVAPRAAEELAGWLAQADGEGGVSSLAREAHLDRSYLFYMVGQSRTSPYESVYRTDDATLYGPTTFQVREAYAAHGLAFGRSANEPDDHLGLELSFLAYLLGLAAEGAGESPARADAACDSAGARRRGGVSVQPCAGVLRHLPEEPAHACAHPVLPRRGRGRGGDVGGVGGRLGRPCRRNLGRDAVRGFLIAYNGCAAPSAPRGTAGGGRGVRAWRQPRNRGRRRPGWVSGRRSWACFWAFCFRFRRPTSCSPITTSANTPCPRCWRSRACWWTRWPRSGSSFPSIRTPSTTPPTASTTTRACTAPSPASRWRRCSRAIRTTPSTSPT